MNNERREEVRQIVLGHPKCGIWSDKKLAEAVSEITGERITESMARHDRFAAGVKHVNAPSRAPQVHYQDEITRLLCKQGWIGTPYLDSE